MTHKILLGLCVHHRKTGAHEVFLRFTQGELEMPGYVETVERSYEGTVWEALRVYCSSDQELDTEMRARA